MLCTEIWAEYRALRVPRLKVPGEPVEGEPEGHQTFRARQERRSLQGSREGETRRQEGNYEGAEAQGQGRSFNRAQVQSGPA